jgi:M6 family metalloprotease-like protein
MAQRTPKRSVTVNVTLRRQNDVEAPRARVYLFDRGIMPRRSGAAGPLAVVLAAAALILPAQAAAFSPFGTQQLLVIPLSHEHPGPGPPGCPKADATQGPICPPYTPSDLQTMLQNGLDAWYSTETYNQTNWQVRVLADPATSDGWWPAPHTLAQYATLGNQFTAGQTYDAGTTILGQAVADGVISASDVLNYHRFLVIDNWNHHNGNGDRAGQTNGVGLPTTYSLPNVVVNLVFGSFNVPFTTTASAVSVEITSPTQVGVDDFLSVVRHELGHQLGEPDLYSQSPCPNMPPAGVAETHSGDDSDCVGPWDHMALDYQGYPGFGAYTRMNLGWVNPDPLGSAVKYVAKSGSTTISLDPLEQPQGRPVAIAIPADLGGVALARLFGITGPFKGFLVECRKHLGDDAGTPGEGVLVSYIDPTRGNDHPEDIARGSSSQTAKTAILSSPPFSSYTNSSYRFTVRYAAGLANGGCQVAINVPFIKYVHLVPAVSWLAGFHAQVGSFGRTASHAVFAGEGVLLNGPHTGLASVTAAGGHHMPQIQPLKRGHLARIRFSYANAGTINSRGGLATVSVTEPYTVSACGPQPDGRLVARVKLKNLKPGQVATTGVSFRARSSGPIGVTIRFPSTGPKPFHAGDVERAVLGFQTHNRHKFGNFRPQRSTIIVTSSRNCPGPVSLTASPLMLPRGWIIAVDGLDGPLLPGHRRGVTVRVQAPKGVGPQALDLPVAISASTPAPAPALRPAGNNTPPYFLGGEPKLLGGLDLLTRIVVPGRAVPPFTIPSPPPAPPARSYPPPPPSRQPSTLTLTCPPSGSFAETGKTTTFSGMLIPAQAGSAVTVVYQPPMGSVITHMASTGAHGSYSDPLTPLPLGNWTAQAHWSGDATRAPADSPLCKFLVSTP